MGVSIEHCVAIYRDKLLDQKSLYEQILVLSQQEEKELTSKPLRLNKVIELLHRKNELLGQIQHIEQQIIPVRNQLQTTQLPDEVKDDLNELLRQIGGLLERLITSDADNEQLLQDTMNPQTTKTVNKNYAINAYKTCAR